MKLLFISACMCSLLLWGCGGEETTPPPPVVEKPVEKPVDPSQDFPESIDSTTSIAWENKKIPKADDARWDCQSMLAGYENWVDYYARALKRQAENPLDMDNLQRMAKLGMQTVEWVGNSLKCNANEAWKHGWEKATEKLNIWKKKSAES
jgi:hypothetical protein